MERYSCNQTAAAGGGKCLECARAATAVGIPKRNADRAPKFIKQYFTAATAAELLSSSSSSPDHDTGSLVCPILQNTIGYAYSRIDWPTGAQYHYDCNSSPPAAAAAAVVAIDDGAQKIFQNFQYSLHKDSHINYLPLFVLKKTIFD